MQRVLTKKDIVVIFLLAVLFSEISGWLVLGGRNVKAEVVAPAENLSTEDSTLIIKKPSYISVPHTLIYSLVLYFPFWIIALTIIFMVMNFEKRQPHDPRLA